MSNKKQRIDPITGNEIPDCITLYPELDVIARQVADRTAFDCNRSTQGIESEMPYRAKYVLERALLILQARV